MAEQHDEHPELHPEEFRHPRRPRQPLLKRLEGHVQGRIVGGLFELMPLLITLIVIDYLIDAAHVFRSLPFIEGQAWDVPGIGLLVLVVIAYVLGLFIRTSPGRKVMEGYSVVMQHIPVVRVIFGLTRQAITSFSGQYNFSRVVFVEWPRDGMLAMGFVTGQMTSNDGSHTVVSVYIPTVPNPTSGNMAFVMEDDVMESNLSVDKAMKLVFSGGIVLPDDLVFARVPMGARDSNDFLGKYHAEPPESEE